MTKRSTTKRSTTRRSTTPQGLRAPRTTRDGRWPGSQRAWTAPTWLSLALLASTLLGTGCGADYAPPSLINKLRIIGARAEPPVLTTAGKSQLDMLVVGNDPAEPLCYAWSFCLFALAQDGNYVCVDPDLELDLGTGPTAEVGAVDAFSLLPKIEPVFKKLGLNPPSQLTGGANADPSDASGFELTVRFKVAEAGSEGGTCPSDGLAWLAKPCVDRSRCLAGYKKIALALDPKDAHSNPKLQGLEIDGVAWPEDVTPTVSCYRGDSEFGQVGQGAVNITPLWDSESQEVIGPNPDPTKSGVLRETMLFSWFSTAGDYDKQRSYDEVPENAFLPPDYGGKVSQTARLWVVVRDGRNGTAWLSRQVEVRSDAPLDGNPLCRVDPALEGCP